MAADAEDTAATGATIGALAFKGAIRRRSFFV
jgi:hypothetical protein